MKASRLLLSALFAVALVPLVAPPASAAPPANDEAGGAVVLHLGDRVSQDTTEATTNAGDDALNVDCGAPFTNASVWYRYTPGTNRRVLLDTSESDYEVGLMVFEGTPTADSLLACGPTALGLRAHAGTTYTVMAFSDTETMGGNLVLSLRKAPPPRAHVSISKRGAVFHGAGAARIHGTYLCKHDENFSFLSAHLRQRAGRLKIQADSGADLRCNGVRHRWSARLVSPVGTFAPGRAVAKVQLLACGFVDCARATADRTVHLRWATTPQRQWMTQATTAPTAARHSALVQQRRWPST